MLKVKLRFSEIYSIRSRTCIEPVQYVATADIALCLPLQYVTDALNSLDGVASCSSPRFHDGCSETLSMRTTSIVRYGGIRSES